MKWKNTAFKYEDIARLCQRELSAAGIRTDFFIVGNGYYYVAWCPVGEAQYNTALKIITSHIN